MIVWCRVMYFADKSTVLIVVWGTNWGIKQCCKAHKKREIVWIPPPLYFSDPDKVRKPATTAAQHDI